MAMFRFFSDLSFFSSRRRHTRCSRDWSSDVCSSDLGAGSYETLGVVDGIARIVGYKAVSGLPLVVVVTFSRADVLAPWFRHLYTFGPVAGFVVAIILLGTVLLMRQTRKIAEKST